MKSLFVAAMVAAACSGVALAGELKQDQKTAAPAVQAQVMSDSEMDKVTAGSAFIPGFGNTTAEGASGGKLQGSPPLPAGQGHCTANFHGGNVSSIGCTGG